MKENIGLQQVFFQSLHMDNGLRRWTFYLVQLNPNWISEHLLTLRSSERLLLSNNVYSIETTRIKNITAASISEYLHYCSQTEAPLAQAFLLKLLISFNTIILYLLQLIFNLTCVTLF